MKTEKHGSTSSKTIAATRPCSLARPSLLNPRSSLRRASVFALVLLAAAAVSATSLNSIRTSAEQLARDGQAATGNTAAEKSLVEPLGELVLAYIDESDRIQRAGREERESAALRSSFEAIHEPLDRIYRRHSVRLEKMSRTLMDQDGDLEALYETPDFQASQLVAANALYYLNWLNYYGARVFDGERRKELLESCESGFSQFAVGDQDPELVNESLLGRGLCYLELANYEWARRDFHSVIESEVSAERKAKARMALLDAYFRGGNRAKTISYARELLDGGLVASDEASLIRFYQLQALLDSADRADGAQAEHYRSEAGAVMTQLRRAGGGWSAKVDSLLASSIKDPAQWAGKADTPAAQWQLAQLFLAKQDCAGAEPMLEKLLASDRGDAVAHQREARYWLGICRFKAKQFGEAATELARALDGAGEPPFAADARYFRFKALEAMMAVDDPPEELVDGYVASLRDLVEHEVDEAHRAEVRYRLAEYLQATGDFPAAIAQYALVESDPGYLLRSRFGTLQCRFELLRAESDPMRRAEIVTEAGKDLASYDRQAAVYAAGAKDGDLSLEEFNAKVTLLRAVHASLAEEGGDLRTAEILAEFSTRFPDQRELAPQASRMRLGALLRLGRYSDAEREIQQGRELLREEGRLDALRGLAASFAKSGRSNESPQESSAAARVAVALYELVDEAGGEPPSLRHKVSIAQLEEKAGKLDLAASSYEEVLERNPNTLAALRGLARIAETQGDNKRALSYWVTYTDKVRAGDTGWFRGQYEQARIHLVAGEPVVTCKRLKALRTAMPGLQDQGLRASLKQLFEEAGC